MAAYQYLALKADGRQSKGIIQADSQQAAKSLLREQGLSLLELTTINEQQTSSWWHFQRTLKREDLALIFRQLATLIASGSAIADALTAVSEQNDTLNIQRLVQGIRNAVLEGQSLAQALRQYPQHIPALYAATIAAGEQSGHLAQVLESLADYAEQQAELKQKLKQALIYPSLMITVSFAIVIFLMVFVVPRIIEVFTDTGQSLPLSTQFLLAISQGLQKYGLWLALLALSFGLVAKRRLQQPSTRAWWQGKLLAIPGLRYLLKTLESARYARTLGILLQAGVDVTEAMQVASAVVQNEALRQRLQYARQQVIEGMSLHKALQKAQMFAPLMLHLLASGEQSGKLAQSLQRSAEHQEASLSRLLATGLALFEPLIILIMGAIVLFIVLAILLPVFSLQQIAV